VNIIPSRFQKSDANGTSLNGDPLPRPTEDGALHKNLQERHMIMIALGGTIGTGLFLASGTALSTAGPGGSLVSYLLISIMVYFVMTSLGNLTLNKKRLTRNILL
jgi:amino acid permease